MVFLIDSVVGAIIELAVQKPIEGAWNRAQRNDRVISILQKVGLDPDRPPDDQFETLYAYALVEWGAFKPGELLNLFRDQHVRAAFERAMQENQPDLWRDDMAELVEAYREQGKFTLDYDPQRELETFSRVFERLVRYSRTPAAARSDHTLQEIRELIADIQVNLQQLSPAEEEEEAQQLHTYLDMTMRQCSGITLAPLDQAKKERRYLTMQRIFINLDAGSSARGAVGRESGLSYSSVIGHAHGNRRLILLGDPGSGKTTVLRYLGLCLAGANEDPDGGWLEHLAWDVHEPAASGRAGMPDEAEEDQHEKVTWSGPAPIPVLVTLRHFARTPFDPNDPQAIWRYVCQMLEREKLAGTLPALQRKAHWGNCSSSLTGSMKFRRGSAQMFGAPLPVWTADHAAAIAG